MILKFWRSEVKISFTGQSPGVSRAVIPPEGLRENLLACILRLLEAAYIPWLMDPFSFFKAISVIFSNFTPLSLFQSSHLFSESLTLLLLSSLSDSDIPASLL